MKKEIKGYRYVTAPPDYPGKIYRQNAVMEHHLVWWQHHNELVPDGFVVHHKNEIKTDNRIENLELLSKSEHARGHATIGRTMKSVVCDYCGETFEKEQRNIKKDQTVFYCCRQHMGLAWWRKL